jgi:hypothetical protein
VTVAFRLRVVAPPSGLASNTVQVATVGWGPETQDGDRASELQIRLTPTGLVSKRDEASFDQLGDQVPNASGWTAVRIRLDFASAFHALPVHRAKRVDLRCEHAVMHVDDQLLRLGSPDTGVAVEMGIEAGAIAMLVPHVTS